MADSRILTIALLAALGLPALAGCGHEDLGTILHEVPKVPGPDDPYPLPELKSPRPTSKSTKKPRPRKQTTGHLPRSGPPRMD